jgi:hypothetical protein
MTQPQWAFQMLKQSPLLDFQHFSLGDNSLLNSFTGLEGHILVHSVHLSLSSPTYPFTSPSLGIFLIKSQAFPLIALPALAIQALGEGRN